MNQDYKLTGGCFICIVSMLKVVLLGGGVGRNQNKTKTEPTTVLSFKMAHLETLRRPHQEQDW